MDPAARGTVTGVAPSHTDAVFSRDYTPRHDERAAVPGAATEWRTPAAMAILVAAVALWAQRLYPVGVLHDDGVYLILGRALARGEGLRYLHLPGAPPATHYPPLYPLVLAALQLIAPSLVGATRVALLLNAVLLGITAAATAVVLRARLGWRPIECCAVAMAATLALPLLFLSSLLLSELLCIALVMAVLPFVERTVERRAEWRVTWRADVVLGVAVGVIGLLRTHLLVLGAAVALVLIIRGGWRRAAVVGASAGVVMMPWQLWAMTHGGALTPELRGSYGSYLGWLVAGVREGGAGLVFRTIRTNGLELAALLADRFAPWTPGWPRLSGLALALGGAIVGVVSSRRRLPVTSILVALYLAVTVCWPYAPWRFVWGVWPLVVVLVAVGLRAAIVRAAAAWRAGVGSRRSWITALAGCVAALVVICGTVRAELVTYRSQAWTRPTEDAERQMASVIRWVRTATAPSDVIIADDDPLVYLMTGRRAVPPVAFTAAEYAARRDAAADRAALRAIARASGARWLVTIVPSTIDAARALAPDFVERAQLPNGVVFEIRR